MIEMSCHCGAVRLQFEAALHEVTDCNCSICRRYGALWAYFPPEFVRIVPPDAVTDTYIWGDKSIEFHRCRNCGCVTHWRALDKTVARMGVNARLMPPAILAQARTRRLDGADSWKVID